MIAIKVFYSLPMRRNTVFFVRAADLVRESSSTADKSISPGCLRKSAA